MVDFADETANKPDPADEGEALVPADPPVPGDAGVPELPNEEVKNDPVEDD